MRLYKKDWLKGTRWMVPIITDGLLKEVPVVVLSSNTGSIVFEYEDEVGKMCVLCSKDTFRTHARKMDV